MNATSTQCSTTPIPDFIEDELANYELQIKKFRAGLVGETKMQKFRLQYGTYAQRQ